MKHTIKIHEATIETKHGATSASIVEDGSTPNLLLGDVIKMLMEKLWFTPAEIDPDDEFLSEYDHTTAAEKAAELIDNEFVLSKSKFDFSSVEEDESIMGSFEGQYAEFYYRGCKKVEIAIPRPKIKVFLWRGIVEDVIADCEGVDVEVIHADDGCPELSDESAANAYLEKLLEEGYRDVKFEEGKYCDELDDDEAEDDF